MLTNNTKNAVYGYPCETSVSREDKIEFVDRMRDGQLSYVLSLIDQFSQDKDSLPKDRYGFVKTVSLKAWIRRNDTRYPKPVINIEHANYGRICLPGIRRYIWCPNIKSSNHELYDDFVDQMFHEQLRNCEIEEHRWFNAHDEYTLLQNKVVRYMENYGTSFGVNIIYGSDGCFISSADSNDRRKLTMDELKLLVGKYEKLDDFINQITEEIKSENQLKY